MSFTAICFLIAVFWIVSGIFGYGLTFAHFQNKFPTIADDFRQKDQWFAFIVGCAGPIGLAAALSAGEPKKYGLRWR